MMKKKTLTEMTHEYLHDAFYHKSQSNRWLSILYCMYTVQMYIMMLCINQQACCYNMLCWCVADSIHNQNIRIKM